MVRDTASNPADFNADRPYGNNDQRHRLVLSGVYQPHASSTLLDGWTSAAIMQLAVKVLF